MSAMKNFIEDVYYMYHDGYSIEDIAAKHDVSMDYVKEVIDIWYDKFVMEGK